jgi:hypothetical protein
MSNPKSVDKAQRAAEDALTAVNARLGTAGRAGGYVPSWRDRVAHRLASGALLLATPAYRRLLTGAWQYGLASAVRDDAEGRPAPVRRH